MSKESISKNYLEAKKALHAWKRLRDPSQRRVLITGADRPGSIGEAIVQSLPLGVTTDIFYGDVCVSNTRRLNLSSDSDTLIMCHGVTHLDWLEECPGEKVHEIIDVNLTGSILMVQDFVLATLEQPWRKQIIMIGSMAYRSVLNGSAAYCASKAGLAHFARCAAWELAPKGYDVFILHPSNTEGTPMTEETIAGLMRYRGLTRGEAEAYWGASLPREHWLQPEDIADTVNFLMAGGAGGYLSGGQIELAGGQR